MSLKIHALPAGVIRDFPVSAVQYQRGFGVTHDTPMIMFVITGGEFPIVVDSGTPEPEFVRKHHGYDFERAPSEHPRESLRNIGVSPADVGLVIHTHLHWDHCGNNDLFDNAHFVVQQAELHFAVDPLEPARRAFENTEEIAPTWSPMLNRFRTVSGDAAVAPGVSLISLPGHTPGSQGVLVETDTGKHLIAGDTIDTRANWEGDSRSAHIPSGSFVNLSDYMASFAKIETLDAVVVPSHDPEVLEKGVFG
ncbi:N-acyl homoserine lactonase family protein [Rhodococcus sp. P1Y]|uniref:N-acyl homoserine lactonase family protein n=1 Tax=Rhodococcus sp. P1Y TaxID=1302308 RepID=UPI000EABDD6F|nr:N-acyl homoserine lactonase family protein [Rhodococcus sp. P1Y]AYJ48872.1 N-acyl homoserine lactonase family protein [Rhodococcus sp. P1Y]